MVILISYSTSEQHICINQLILVKGSVKWIHKLLWPFATGPPSLCLSYRAVMYTDLEYHGGGVTHVKQQCSLFPECQRDSKRS